MSFVVNDGVWMPVIQTFQLARSRAALSAILYPTPKTLAALAPWRPWRFSSFETNRAYDASRCSASCADLSR
jgi:hypothetical protein